jgi:hypothetical protein
MRYNKDELGAFKQHLLQLEHEIVAKTDTIKNDINKAISILNKYNSKFIDSIIQEISIPLQGSVYEILEDYDKDFFYKLPRQIIFNNTNIIFHYNDYDNYFTGLFTITIDKNEFNTFKELVTYLEDNIGNV